MLTAHTVGRFTSSGTGYPLAIEGDPGFYMDGDVHLLLFPGEPPTSLRCNVGTLRTGLTKPIDVPGGILQVSGSNTATLPKRPEYSNPQFKVMFAFDTKGQPTSVGVAGFNAQTGQVRLDKECYAAVEYTSYVSKGLELFYTPAVDNFTLGTKTTYGVIAAFRVPNTMIIYQVQPPAVGDAGNDEIELYRIVSYKVTTFDGEFEMPPGYPQSGTYPSLPTEIDVSTSLKTERVHEIGFMDSRGRGWIRSYAVPNLAPYVGVLSYSPPTVCLFSTLGDKYDKDLQLKAKNFIASRGLGCKNG